METGRANSPNIGRGYRRLASAAAGGAVVTVALLMALSPAVGALKPHVIVAPYKNTILSESKSLSTGGNCKYTGVVNSNHWIPKTGNVTSFV